MAALEHLQHSLGEGLTQTQPGRRLSLSPGAVTALIDRLERAGHVERRANPRGRRGSVARPRPSGLEEARCHLLPIGAELLEASKKLSDEERAAVGEYLETITEVFARPARTKG